MINREEFDKLEGWFWYEEAEVVRDALNYINHLKGVIVEAGSYKGKSSAAIASCTNEQIYSIDPFTWDGGTYDKFIEQTSKYPNITGVKSDAVAYRNSFNEPIKLLFIDCDHSYELTKEIYDLYEPLVVDGGIVLFHDSSPLNYDLTQYINGKTNEPIPGDSNGGWIGPTMVLQEARKQHKQWVEGSRSIHGIVKGVVK